MPGINVYTLKGFESNPSYNYDQLAHQVLFDGNNFQVGIQHHENYPFSIEHRPKFDIIMEGQVYNYSIPDFLEGLEKRFNSPKELGDFIKTVDGEFVIFMKNKETGAKKLINDQFSRLPMYIYQDTQSFIITRNISFITQQRKLSYSPLALSENLMFGFNLGNKTVWNEVKRMPPNAVVVLDALKPSLEIESFFKWTEMNGTATIDAVLPHLMEAFDKGLANRLEQLNAPSISMSGGLDSRFVAAGIKKLGGSVKSVTFARNDNSYDADLTYSKEIMTALDMIDSHVAYKLPTVEPVDFEELNGIKQSLNALSMSFMMPYLRDRRQNKEDVITGFGGDTYLVGLHPLRLVSTKKQLFNFILKYWTLCPIDLAAKIGGVTPVALENNLMDYLSELPFEDMNDNYTYFLMRHHAMNYAFEGEDRIRHYAWSTAPIYNPEVIRLGLSIRQKDKKYGRLYHRLFNEYPGNLNEIVNPNWMTTVSDLPKIKKIHAKQTLKTRLPLSMLFRMQGITWDQFQQASELKHLIEKHKDATLHLSELPETMKTKMFWQLYSILYMMDRNKN